MNEQMTLPTIPGPNWHVITPTSNTPRIGVSYKDEDDDEGAVPHIRSLFRSKEIDQLLHSDFEVQVGSSRDDLAWLRFYGHKIMDKPNIYFQANVDMAVLLQLYTSFEEGLGRYMTLPREVVERMPRFACSPFGGAVLCLASNPAVVFKDLFDAIDHQDGDLLVYSQDLDRGMRCELFLDPNMNGTRTEMVLKLDLSAFCHYYEVQTRMSIDRQVEHAAKALVKAQGEAESITNLATLLARHDADRK